MGALLALGSIRLAAQAASASGRAPAATAIRAAPATADTGSIDIAPGSAVLRDFGALALDIRVDGDVALVEVAVRLAGRVMLARTLTPDSPAVVVDVVNGATAARGTLAARFAYPGARSALTGDWTVSQGGAQTPFRGDVAAWSWTGATALQRQTVWITPELRAETRILFTADASAQVLFLAGTQPLVSLTLSQGANDVVYAAGVTVGTVRINPGMTLHLQPATPTQQGQVFLQGTFASSNLPQVQYAGAIATWNYVRPP